MTCRSMSLILLCGILTAFGQGSAEAKERKIDVVGIVVMVAEPEYVVSGIAKRVCEDRLLLRVTRRRGSFRPGDYLVLQYAKPPFPCELPREMFSGQSVWRFQLNEKPAGEGPLRKILPVWEDAGSEDERTAETPYGRIAISRFGGLTRLDGGQIEHLPLDTMVREFTFGPRSFQRERR